ncbi:MAG: hypothetical protein NZM09_08185 [Ignavibacterium sp.]|nr:hypothetical protein [Ignavibacterium sp.]MDW8375661.1 hypothetical protein [Ignavibacteriales bacterium]
MKSILLTSTLILLLVLVSLPRFNWRPLPEPLNSFVGGKPFDVEQYEKYVSYFRGNQIVREELESPFSHRPLIPFLASLLPFDELTSLNLINILIISIGMIYLLKFLWSLKFSNKMVFIGGLLFVVSFPAFYYTTSGYIDASLVGMILIFNYFLYTNKYYLFLIFFLIASLIKETVIVTFLASVIYINYKEKGVNKYYKNLLTLILFFLIQSLIKYFAPSKNIFFWKPNFETIIYNLERIKTYVSFILTLGIPGFFTILNLINFKKFFIPYEIFLSLIVGALSGFILWFYSIFSAHADGRHLWVIYPYTVPIATNFINYLFEEKFSQTYKLSK